MTTKRSSDIAQIVLKNRDDSTICGAIFSGTNQVASVIVLLILLLTFISLLR